MNARALVQFRSRREPNSKGLLPFFGLFFALAVVLFLSGCVGLTGAGTPATNTGLSSSGGTLSSSAISMSFGSVVDGSISSQNLTLTNTGSGTITISQATVTGTGFSLVGGTPTLSIGAGQNHTFQIEFAPTTPGAATGNIAIASNATNPQMAVSLTGTGTAALSITTQPISQTVTVGQTATFSVVASGSGTLTYQWKKNGTNISGATAATYTTPPTTAAENGSQFSVLVTDANGSLTSIPATLTVTATPVAPSITAQPANQTVAAGQSATFSVSATGTSPLSYQWQKNGTAISGATSASYTTPATTSSDNGAQFTVTVTNSVGSVTSNAATLTVNVPPSITTQPANQTVLAGQSATFSVTATGTGTLTYQWKKNGGSISGATSASYTTPATTASDNGAQFTVTITGTSGSVTSNAATLTVIAPPSITTQPASQTVIAGQTATFSVVAAGTAPLNYQWLKNGTAISGATSSSYTTPATTTADNGAQFTVTVTNTAGNITSNPATLTVNAATFVLNANPTSLSFGNVTTGTSSALPVTLTNAGNSNVTISNVTISGAGFTASGVSAGQILAPSQTATLNVTFAPSSTGTVNGSVSVASNATNSPAVISFSGTGVQPVSHSVALSWTASTSTVTGYNVYRGSVSGGPYTKQNSALIAAINYTDSTVQSGQTYYYVVTSVDSSGMESTYSNQVSATIP